MKKILLVQFLVLLAGTLFAWFNFIKEYVSWINNSACTIGCAVGANPFLTPCFGGAIFFTIALILHLVILRKSK
jgi:hypothetical protein